MQPRLIAIGDIHGQSAALSALLEQITPNKNDTLVFLGDYIDRGPDSKGVIDQLLNLEHRCNVIPLMGNHEIMLLDALRNPRLVDAWLHESVGGLATLESYGTLDDLNAIPPAHRQFLERLRRYHETATHFFVHANYLPNYPLADQPDSALFWESLDSRFPEPHFSGKIAVVGHTPQVNKEILITPHLFGVDLGCGNVGVLAGLEISTGTTWQVPGRVAG